MKVEEIMTSRVVTVEMDDSLRVVKEIFENANFHHLLVIESGKLFGIVSEKDLLRNISTDIGTVTETPRDKATLNKRVHQVMTRNPITLRKKASVERAIELFNSNDISCIPIIDSKHKPVGILSWRDILKALQPKKNEK